MTRCFSVRAVSFLSEFKNHEANEPRPQDPTTDRPHIGPAPAHWCILGPVDKRGASTKSPPFSVSTIRPRSGGALWRGNLGESRASIRMRVLAAAAR